MSSPLVEQFRKGGISRDVRLTAAHGVLPLKPTDQVELLFLLTRDRDEEIRAKAEQSLTTLPPDSLASVLKDRSTNGKVLNFLATRLEAPDLQQAVLQNPATEDETIRRMIPLLSTELIELVVINQTRILRHTPILEALEASPRLSSDQRRRLAELRHDFRIPVRGAPAAVAAAAAVSETLRDLGDGPPEQEEPEPRSLEEALVIYGDGDGETAELSEEEKKKRESVFQRIVRMTTAEKMIEALKGDREARLLLVRDRNRVVYSAVLDSPKITDSDIDSYASMRNVSPEVLRIIGGKPTWTKRYSVAHELVKNPKTPIEVSMKLISRLAQRDLKRLTKDRNVSEAVRRQAQKLTRAT